MFHHAYKQYMVRDDLLGFLIYWLCVFVTVVENSTVFSFAGAHHTRLSSVFIVVRATKLAFTGKHGEFESAGPKSFSDHYKLSL